EADEDGGHLGSEPSRLGTRGVGRDTGTAALSPRDDRDRLPRCAVVERHLPAGADYRCRFSPGECGCSRRSAGFASFSLSSFFSRAIAASLAGLFPSWGMRLLPGISDPRSSWPRRLPSPSGSARPPPRHVGPAPPQTRGMNRELSGLQRSLCMVSSTVFWFRLAQQTPEEIADNAGR